MIYLIEFINMRKRSKYLFLIVFVICIWLLSRYLGYPLWVWDVLYWVMLYFLMRFIFVKKNKIHSLYLAIILWIFVELISIVNFWDLNFIKNNIVFRTIFGYDFSLKDISLYVCWIIWIFGFDKTFLK